MQNAKRDFEVDEHKANADIALLVLTSIVAAIRPLPNPIRIHFLSLSLDLVERTPDGVAKQRKFNFPFTKVIRYGATCSYGI